MEKYEIQKLRDLPIEKVAKEMGDEGGAPQGALPLS